MSDTPRTDAIENSSDWEVGEVRGMRNLARELERENAALREALKGLLDNAVVLSRDYLYTFREWPDNKEIQGWDKARWLRAADAADYARAVLEKAGGALRQWGATG